MLIAAVILFILCLIILTKYILYRRQIISICRQLQFLEEHVTNKRIQSALKDREIIRLGGLIDSMYDRQQVRERDMQTKDRRLKETLTNVSHDIRTPLTSIKGYFQLLMAEPDECRRAAYADIISGRMQDLEALLEELFTYTKLENEEYPLDLACHNYTQLVLETLFSFYENFKEAEMNPVMQIEETPAFVQCNEVAVKRVLSNVIKNAILHGDGDIKIEYHVGADQVDFICENSLKDEKVDMMQVFDRLYKADLARSHSSSGLGLAIAKELVEQMNGAIYAEQIKDRFRISVRMRRYETM